MEPEIDYVPDPDLDIAIADGEALREALTEGPNSGRRERADQLRLVYARRKRPGHKWPAPRRAGTAAFAVFSGRSVSPMRHDGDDILVPRVPASYLRPVMTYASARSVRQSVSTWPLRMVFAGKHDNSISAG